jgi:tRNA uridine 5-carboxymethylaminomethyl modification enzyme
MQTYDVIVVGAGHAGCEAAYTAAKMGAQTLLITMNMQVIGQMSCNPAMGGVAKGQIVREIDALGGMTGIITDLSTIQFRMLNRSKGPAMWSPRTQNDRMLFAEQWRLKLEQTENLDFWQEMVSDLIIEKEQIDGVKTSIGLTFKAKKVILTNGTFLNGLIHIGEKNFGGGRAGERQATGITERLNQLGFESGRMKTGTPPRVDGRSLNFEKMEEQTGDPNPGKMSFEQTIHPVKKQRSCWITYTNPNVHEILETGFDRSPMFNGSIKSTGPRYCPSIEDKINRFSERDRHQIFAEPEGWNTVEIYVNGFSTSLPYEVQEKAIQYIPGFEKAKLFRPGYAIEYDYFPPTQLSKTLETKLIKGLYFAGQINGTTGYEEAACQGLMAAINAVKSLKEEEPLILSRDQAYIGVLIDDLVTKGTEEPYRMFTSRAEFRLTLRQGNADERLTPIGYAIGLANDKRIAALENKISGIKHFVRTMENQSLALEHTNSWLARIGETPLKQQDKAISVLKRPKITAELLTKNDPLLQDKLRDIGNESISEGEIRIKYQVYLKKEQEHASRLKQSEDLKLPSSFDYANIKSLGSEAIEKLNRIKPATLGQASRISGISPADISVLLINYKSGKIKDHANS